MRNLILASIVIVFVGISSISSLVGRTQASQLDTSLVSNQQESPPAPDDSVPLTAIQETQQSASDMPIVETPVPEPESVLQSQMEGQLGEMPAEFIVADSGCCQDCNCQPCCCKPGPVPTTLVLVDPCTGCSYEICVTVPPCCVGNTPVVNWRGGIFGRRVAELCWSCCDEHVKVVVTRHGKVRVHG